MRDNIFGTLLRRASYSSTGTLVARITAALAGIVMARSVGAKQFGLYAALWALVNLNSSFTEIGVKVSLKREGARHPDSLPCLLGNALIVKISIGICAMVIAYLFSSVVTKNEKAPLIYLPLALACISTICTELFFAALEVKGRQKLVAFFEIGRGVVFLSGFLALDFIKLDIVSFAWFQGLLYTVTLVIVCITIVPIVAISTDLSRIKTQITSSLVFGISSIIFSISTQLPILLLSHFRSEDEVGYFAVALRFVTIIFIVGAGANNNTFLPALFGLYKTNREKFRHVCEYILRSFVPIGIFMACALYVCSDALILILMGEEYNVSIGVLRILCWTVILDYSVFAASAALTTADRMWTKIALQVFFTILGFVVGILVIRHYGVYGASFTILTISLARLFLYTFTAHRKYLLKVSKLKKYVFPFGLFGAFGILITVLFPQAFLLRTTIFFLVSVIALGPPALRMFRNFSLISFPRNNIFIGKKLAKSYEDFNRI